MLDSLALMVGYAVLGLFLLPLFAFLGVLFAVLMAAVVAALVDFMFELPKLFKRRKP
jgi:uncharacterized membrane protein YraQ (UPF0718 family)